MVHTRISQLPPRVAVAHASACWAAATTTKTAEAQHLQGAVQFRVFCAGAPALGTHLCTYTVHCLYSRRALHLFARATPCVEYCCKPAPAAGAHKRSRAQTKRAGASAARSSCTSSASSDSGRLSISLSTCRRHNASTPLSCAISPSPALGALSSSI